MYPDQGNLPIDAGPSVKLGEPQAAEQQGAPMSTFSADSDWTRPDTLPTRRRRRRWPVVVLIVIVALAGLAVLGDRLAARYAENRIATEIQKQGFGAKPDVTIDGFPFLTQVLDRYFPHAHMTARDVR